MKGFGENVACFLDKDGFLDPNMTNDELHLFFGKMSERERLLTRQAIRWANKHARENVY